MKTNSLFIILDKPVFRFALVYDWRRIRFVFESEDDAVFSTKRSGNDQEEKSEWLEQENNDSEFISYLLGEQFGEENRSGVPLKCFEYQERDSPFKSFGEEYKYGVSEQTPFARDRDCENKSGDVCIISNK